MDNSSAAGLLIRKLTECRLSILMQSNPVANKGKCQQTHWHSNCLNSPTGYAARVAGKATSVSREGCGDRWEVH